MILAHDFNEGNRTQDVRISQDITFDTMMLTTLTLQGLKESGFHRPSPIQLHGIPLGKCGFDLLLEAKSGTGKTAVFTVIALEKLDLNMGLQVIILAPTREIAMQIHDVIKQIGVRYEGLCVEVVMGGLPILDDIEKFKKNVHIVVGSPGRLKHLIQDKHIVTTSVRLLVLDEADKLMEKSFGADIKYIYLHLPQQKQVIMSSATFPDRSKYFIANYVQNVQHICPDSTNVLLGIEQRVALVTYSSNIVKQTEFKFAELLKILSNRQFKQCLIFCNYQVRVSELHKMLNKEKWPAGQLYGQQKQLERLDALKILQEYKCRLLIATDLAARGIDASNVDLVINFESPGNWQTYLHRIGRAGRFGSYGMAITILSEGVEDDNFKALIESLKIPFMLKDFWSSTPYCINNNNTFDSSSLPDIENYNFDTNVISKTDEKKSYSKLWVALTENENRTDVESFGDLCESFTEPCSKIDLFNDLVQSFEENKDDSVSEKLNFSKLNLVELSYEDHSFKNVTFEIDSVKCENQDSELRTLDENLQSVAGCSKVLNSKESHDQMNKESLNVTDFRDDNSNENVQNGENKSDTEFSKINSALKVDLNGHDVKNANTNCNTEAHDNNKIDVANISQALADFNLPSSFMSLKQKQIENKRLANTHNRNEVNIEEKNRKGRRRKKINCSTSYKINEQSNGNRNEESVKVLRDIGNNENEYVTTLLTQSSPGYHRRHQDGIELPSTSKYINKPKQTRTYRSRNDQETRVSSECHNKNYIKWYNTLKLQVKQIELSVYLNEISKL